MCRVEYLSKISPAPASNAGSFGGALVERMAGRILVFFMRHASLLRPLSQAGKVQLAKVSPAAAATLQHSALHCQPCGPLPLLVLARPPPPRP